MSVVSGSKSKPSFQSLTPAHSLHLLPLTASPQLHILPLWQRGSRTGPEGGFSIGPGGDSGVSLPLCIPPALPWIRSSARGMGRASWLSWLHPLVETLDLALTRCQGSTCRLKHTLSLRLDCLPCVTHTQSLAWLSL